MTSPHFHINILWLQAGIFDLQFALVQKVKNSENPCIITRENLSIPFMICVLVFPYIGSEILMLLFLSGNDWGTATEVLYIEVKQECQRRSYCAEYRKIL